MLFLAVLHCCFCGVSIPARQLCPGRFGCSLWPAAGVITDQTGEDLLEVFAWIPLLAAHWDDMH